MIYLDNGATSFPKPDVVADAVEGYIRHVGSNINRGTYTSAYSAGAVVLETRAKLCEMMNGYAPRNTIFTPGDTYSLNFMIKGLARPGDKFLTSGMEHNAVYRVLYQLEEQMGTKTEYMTCNRDGELELEKALDMIDENLRAVVMVHASNVSGTILPIEEIGRKCEEKGVFFIVDAAQTAGTLPIDMKERNIDGLALPAHKSMLGPQGLGAMLLSDRLASEMTPLIAGGTGSHSDIATMPEELPDRFEAGTMNIPAIFGLHASCEWLEGRLGEIREHEMKLTKRFIDGISDLENVRIVGPLDMDKRVSTLSLDFLDDDNAIVGFRLSQDYGIMTRVGLHCAPLAHKSLGTFPEGTVRFSIGAFNTEEDIDGAIKAVREIAQ